MLVLRLNEYVPVKDEKQIATTWLVSKTQDFTEYVIQEKSTSKLNLATYDIIIPTGEVWYGKAIRHFDNSNYDYTTGMKKVINTDDINSHVLLDGDIIIDSPTITIDKNEILSDSDTFKIVSSKYRGNDSHASTIWVITDISEDVLFYSEVTEGDLESIDVSRKTILNKSVIKVYCIHKSVLGVESSIGIRTLELTNFNFEIVTNLNQVIPLKDLTIEFRAINSEVDHGVVGIVVKEASTLETYFDKTMLDVDSVTIPWYVINPNAILLLEVNARDLNGELVYTTYNIVVEKGKAIDINNSNYVYKDDIYYTNTLITELLPNGITSEELGNNSILLPMVGSKKVYKYSYDTITNIYVNKGEVETLSLLSNDNSNTYIKLLSGDNILIDTLNSNGKPCFLHYTYNRSKNKATLVSSFVREDETICLGKTNSIVWVSDVEFIYIPVGMNILKKYNIATKTITTLNTIPNPNVNTCIMFRIPDNRILIIGGSEYTNYVYDIEDNMFRDGISTYPNSFIDRDLKSVKLINGDILVFKTNYITTDTENSVLYFDYEKCDFKELNFVFEKDKVPTTTLSLLSGEIILSRYNFKEYWEDTTNQMVVLGFK